MARGVAGGIVGKTTHVLSADHAVAAGSSSALARRLSHKKLGNQSRGWQRLITRYSPVAAIDDSYIKNSPGQLCRIGSRHRAIRTHWDVIFHAVGLPRWRTSRDAGHLS
jgi:hypothetical protein